MQKRALVLTLLIVVLAWATAPAQNNLAQLKHFLSMILRAGGVAPVADDVLTWQGSNQIEWAPLTALATFDHGLLAGLGDDDHAQYLLLTGRAGGQVANGGTAASDDLTLHSTSNATKGNIYFGTAGTYDDANERLGVGIAAPTNIIHAYDAGVSLARIESGGAVAAGWYFENTAGEWMISIGASANLAFVDSGGAGGSAMILESGALTNTLVVDTNSRVGINTDAPATLLHLYNTAIAAVDTIETIEANGATNDAILRLERGTQTWDLVNDGGLGDYFVINDDDAGTNPFWIAAPGVADNLVLNGGNVGIGVNPIWGSDFHMYSGTANLVATIQSGLANSTVTMQLQNDVQAWAYYVDGGTGDIFCIADFTSTTFPFIIEPTAPTNTMYLDSTGFVALGTNAPGGALDITSTTGALIVPRMTQAQRLALPATNGSIVYDTTNNAFYFCENGAWVTGSGLT